VNTSVISRLAVQVIANLDAAASPDDIVRACVGMALSHDLGDDQLQDLLAEADRLLRRPEEMVA